MNKVLYVTSFNNELYEATGRKLIESYLAHNSNKTNTKLLVCTESTTLSQENPLLETYDITNHKLLEWYLNKYKQIIPDYLGGEYTHCECENWEERHCKTHIKGCPYHWMNRNAYRWFRKLVALKAALNYAGDEYNYLVWLDSDNTFVAPIPEDYYDKWLNRYDCFYFWGRTREAPEVGILGFNIARKGPKLIDLWFQRYYNGHFIHNHRWDDGYQFGRVLLKTRSLNNAGECCYIPSTDLAKLYRAAHPMTQHNIWKHIQHDKGTHGRILGIMK